jgi:hypothetical protein
MHPSRSMSGGACARGSNVPLAISARFKREESYLQNIDSTRARESAARGLGFGCGLFGEAGHF